MKVSIGESVANAWGGFRVTVPSKILDFDKFLFEKNYLSNVHVYVVYDG